MRHRSWPVLAAALALSQFSPSSVLAAPNQIENVALTEDASGNSAVLVIEAARKLKHSVPDSGDPSILTLRMEEDVACPRAALPKAGRNVVGNISYDCGGQEPDRKLRSISLALGEGFTYNLSQNDWIISIDLKKSVQLKAAADAAGAARPGGGTSAGLAVPYSVSFQGGPARRSLSADPVLEEFVQVGLSNHEPLEIARMELDLAEHKLFESRRNFFPAVAGRVTRSRGATLSDPNDPSTRADFERKELGIELGQPIFQSGRLLYADKQAKAQKSIAELQISRLTQETTFDIIEAVYNLVQAGESLELRKKLSAESDKIMETTRRKKEIGVASESEYLGVLSGGNQIAYKTLSQEKDLELARTSLMGKLNVETIPGTVNIDLARELARRQPREKLSLDNLLNAALANRPEIKIARLTSQFREYGRKVARAEYLFKVDASGFLGQSGAAFRNETLTMKDSYSLGVKGVLYFGGSSVSPTLSQEKTAPDLGSTSRTETRAESITAGFLDSLAARSAFYQARIDEAKAGEEERKAVKDVALELKKAFFNYEKAKVQIESAKKELVYREKEAAIATVKDRLHQVEAPQYLQTIAGLTEARTGVKEATAFYLISLAALEKAVGLSLVR